MTPSLAKMGGGSAGHALQVGGALAAVGAGSLTAIAAAARGLSSADFATFVTWLTIANLVGLAFAVIETYLPRLLVSVRSQGTDEKPLLAAFTRGVTLAVGVLVVVVLATAPLTLPRLFAGDRLLLILAVCYLVVMAMQSLQRAVAVGRELFVVFPAQLVTDGVARLVLSLLALASGVATPAGYAVLLCIAAFLGVLGGHVADRDWLGWRGPQRVALQPLALLAAASIGPLVVNNIGVPWLTAGGDVSPRVVGAVAGALTLSRLPTLMVGALYGPVLSPLARAVEDRRSRDFRRIHLVALSGALGVAALFTLSFAFAGTWLLELYLGPGYRLGILDLALMGAGSGLMFVCVVEQASLVALAAWERVAWSWFLAILICAGALALPLDPVLRVSLAVSVAPLVAAGVMSACRVSIGRAVLRST